MRCGTAAGRRLIDSLEPGAQDPGMPLQHIDTLQVTPRVASTTRESRARSAWVVAQRIDQLLRSGFSRYTVKEPEHQSRTLGLQARQSLPELGQACPHLVDHRCRAHGRQNSRYPAWPLPW